MCIPRLLATHGLHLITGTATSAHGSCESRPVRQIRFAAHFFPHTRPQDTHALEVGDACLECQGSLVNTYCTSAVYRPRGRARPPSAYCDLRTFSLTRSDAGLEDHNIAFIHSKRFRSRMDTDDNIFPTLSRRFSSDRLDPGEFVCTQPTATGPAQRRASRLLLSLNFRDASTNVRPQVLPWSSPWR